MKMRKLFAVILSGVFMMAALFGCTTTIEPSTESEEAPSTTEKPTFETVSPTEETKAVDPEKLPKLAGLVVDGGYAIAFDPDTELYSVSIPAGRPRVPKISATADEGLEVRLYQATIPDGEDQGTAKALVTSEEGTRTYSVVFRKDAALGFQLQYKDQYDLRQALDLKEGLTYTSSAPSILLVSKAGVVTAESLSEQPVTLTAFENGTKVAELVVDRVVKAPLNIFLIMGQSNAYGWLDVPSNYSDFYEYAAVQIQLARRPKAGTVWCEDSSNGYDDFFYSEFYDLSKGRVGFSPALGKTWYEMTGEKCFMLQTAIGSTPIECWTPDPGLKFFGLDCYKNTVDRFNVYKERFSAADSGYEINRIYGFWLQGETCQEYVYSSKTFTWEFKHSTPNYEYSGDWYKSNDPSELQTSKEYYDYFIEMYDGLVKDVGLEFMGILPVRAMTSVSSRKNIAEQQLVDLVPARAAQFALNYLNNGNIRIVTLETEVGRTESYSDSSAEGWGYLGCNNIHYNQRGYNAIGSDAALNTLKYFSGDEITSGEEIRVVDSDGRTFFKNGDEILLTHGEERQITAYVLPLFSSDAALTFSIEDTSVCTMNAYGVIKANASEGSVGKSTRMIVSNGKMNVTLGIRITR